MSTLIERLTQWSQADSAKAVGISELDFSGNHTLAEDCKEAVQLLSGIKSNMSELSFSERLIVATKFFWFTVNK